MTQQEKFDFEWGTNSTVYRRLHKKRLEQQDLIRCSRCRYHRGENEGRKWYGGFEQEKYKDNIVRYADGTPGTKYIHFQPRHPSWKLTFKNSKQWMDKGVRYKWKTRNWTHTEMLEIKF